MFVIKFEQLLVIFELNPLSNAFGRGVEESVAAAVTMPFEAVLVAATVVVTVFSVALVDDCDEEAASNCRLSIPSAIDSRVQSCAWGLGGGD